VQHLPRNRRRQAIDGAGDMNAALAYIRIVDRINLRLGRLTMYGIFVMMGILLWSSISKAFFYPSPWTLEMAQFTMVAYYILGGPYSIQLGSNVRMDLIYGDWTHRRKAWVDSFSVMFLIFYLAVLLVGAYDSTVYSFQYGGERSPTAWRPYLWPIKVTMCIGIFMMLLQAVSELFKDILRLNGRDI
jgi:TRAP-type mannitol/chloroaromatic compound transport system permease small subunit